jgi:hypothetical protein
MAACWSETQEALQDIQVHLPDYDPSGQLIILNSEGRAGDQARIAIDSDVSIAKAMKRLVQPSHDGADFGYIASGDRKNKPSLNRVPAPTKQRTIPYAAILICIVAGVFIYRFVASDMVVDRCDKQSTNGVAIINMEFRMPSLGGMYHLFYRARRRGSQEVKFFASGKALQLGELQTLRQIVRSFEVRWKNGEPKAR